MQDVLTFVICSCFMVNRQDFLVTMVTGGLTAVIWTDFIQTIIMVVGAFILMVMSKFVPGKKIK